MRNNTPLRTLNIVLGFILVAITAILLTKIVYDFKYNYVLESYDIPMNVRVVNETKIGFNTATDALHFGIVPIGYGSSTRRFNITNKYNYNILAKIEPYGGNLSEWVILTDYEFLIQPNESKKVEAIVHIPNETNIGVYEANLKINLYKR